MSDDSEPENELKRSSSRGTKTKDQPPQIRVELVSDSEEKKTTEKFNESRRRSRYVSLVLIKAGQQIHV